MNNESRQVIIVRKDLGMSVGKMAAQASHASMAFLIQMIKDHGKGKDHNIYPVWEDYAMTKPVKFLDDKKNEEAKKARIEGRRYISWPTGKKGYEVAPFDIDEEAYEWMKGAFTKTICEAKNRNHLMKAVKYAEELGLKEGKDFFLIKDNCYTELEPEDEDGRTLTAIGFRPMATETAHKISKKFQLFNTEIKKPKKGKWTIPSELSKMFDIYECSACHGRQVMVSDKYKYCPMCGAEMER
jgi:PTH2 family peptidyl-tRNA hydrolase